MHKKTQYLNAGGLQADTILTFISVELNSCTVLTILYPPYFTDLAFFFVILKPSLVSFVGVSMSLTRRIGNENGKGI